MKTSVYTPFQVGAKDRIVGLFVIGAVLLFLVGFLIPVIQRLQAAEGIPFYTVLDQTYGIAPNALVSLRGVSIGEVSGVGITEDGMVRVDIALSPDYQDFYTRRSRLSVDTNIGVSTILTGSGLILHPGGLENGVMEAGDLIITDAPRGIASFLETVDLALITDQVTEIIANVEGLTTGLEENQDKVYRSLDNLEAVTASLAVVTNTLPGMVAEVNASLVAIQATLGTVDGMIVGTDANLQATLANAVALTNQATLTLAEAEVLFRATTPVLSQLPTVMMTTDIALQSITDLTDQLSRSWLLGGSSEARPASYSTGPTFHPHDDSLYRAASDN